jgi:hypothetical protein
MIFRRLYKRRITRLFAPALTARQVERIFHDLSEWDSFRWLLPGRVRWLFFTPAMTETEALSAVARMAAQVLATTPDESQPVEADPKPSSSE